MLSTRLFSDIGRTPRILCIGAHCDDIEIGCGGSLITLQQQYADAQIQWLILSGDERRHAEARSAYHHLLGKEPGDNLFLHSFRDGYLPFHAVEVKEAFHAVSNAVSPDLIFTHFRGDLHQDHRLAAELTLNAFRNHMVLEYEIPKYDGDLGAPNVYFGLSEVTKNRKIDAIVSAYTSQTSKQWFSAATFESLMRIRGIECGSGAEFAEAFYGRKIRIDG